MRLVLATSRGDSSQADKFETLCIIQADLTTTPYVKKLGEKGKMWYTRNFDVVLLVGLTELKAQIAWIDPVTVSTWGIFSLPFLILIAWVQGEEKRFEMPFLESFVPKAKPNLQDWRCDRLRGPLRGSQVMTPSDIFGIIQAISPVVLDYAPACYNIHLSISSRGQALPVVKCESVLHERRRNATMMGEF